MILKIIRILLLSTIVLYAFILSGCQSPDKKTIKDVREIAWNSLSDSERNEVIGDWKDATISKVTADTKRFNLIDLAFEGKEVTIVTFRSSKNSVLGDISKLVDEKTQKVIGGAFRE